MFLNVQAANAAKPAADHMPDILVTQTNTMKNQVLEFQPTSLKLVHPVCCRQHEAVEQNDVANVVLYGSTTTLVSYAFTCKKAMTQNLL